MFSLVKYGEDKMTVRTFCMMCRQTEDFEVPAKGIDAYIAGEKMQDAFPELSAERREQMISGTCPSCWNKMFPEE